MKEKVIFLDRDGVINKYPGNRNYVTGLDKFKFIRGSLHAIKRLTGVGFKIFVVSNQAGVAKGLYTKKTLNEMTSYMLEEVKKSGGLIQKVVYCLHSQNMNCSCRKPKAGLLRRATKGMRLDLKNSYFIGDSIRDVLAGRSFGCKTVLVLCGREKLKDASSWQATPDFIAKSLSDAARHILAKNYERA